MSHLAQPRRSFLPLVKRWATELSGWLLITLGVAALILPGPGLLFLVAGFALLSMQYKWAKRILRPVKSRAFHLAAKGVQTWPRIALSTLGALAVSSIGILWGIGFPEPAWWPISSRWWLPGGWGTGVTLISSGALAIGLIVYSFHRFRGHKVFDDVAVSPARTP
ncbi:PGPGW domain-containing protein [Paeniglutamicibacter antarcticus]|uniref:Transmembrane protein PGPGW n=1 Tax=Paeniglutamicibacter antarcticus TaxID=494023 RepID=A0ABP9TLB2_9MICC